MGGDCPPAELFQAVVKAAGEFPSVHFVVYSTQTALDEIYSKGPPPLPCREAHVEFQVAAEVIEMGDDPLVAIRQKKNASLVVGLKALRKRHLDAFVSAGNTGSIIVGATLLLPLLPGVKRPALLAVLPTAKGPVAIIDVGGNVSCKAHHLVQFAMLGASFQRCYGGIAKPRIGLLNIGVESKKGTSEVRLAYQLLTESAASGELAFVGNVEGKAVFRGDADVLVTDGFTGNVLLKTSEGVAAFLLQQLSTILGKITPEHKKEILSSLKRQFDDEEYPGAIVCGVDRVVVKCHGHSSPRGFLMGIRGAIKLSQNCSSQIKHS